MDAILSVLAPIGHGIAVAVLWLEQHMAVVAWLMGWTSAICTGQYAKRLEPPTWHTDNTQRLLQLITSLAGFVVAYMLWPAGDEHPGVYAWVVGISAPFAYDAGRAIVSWKFPEVARRMGWACIQAEKAEKAS